MYPSKRGKNQVSDKTKRQLMGVRTEDMRKAIDRYVAEKEAAPYDRQWLNGSTWFNGRYLDYINDDYTPPPVPKASAKASARSQHTQYRSNEETARREEWLRSIEE